MKKYRSSIFSSSTVDWRDWKFPGATLLAVVIVVGVEIALHIATPHLPDPNVWGHGEGATKFVLAEQLATTLDGQSDGQSDGQLDVLIVGPSHASVGISPREMQDATPEIDLQTFNGALMGLDNTVAAFTLEHVFDPLLDPRVLVISATPITENRNHPILESNCASFFGGPAQKAILASGLESTWLQFLIDNVYLFRYHKRGDRMREGRIDGRKTLDLMGYRASEGRFDEAARQAMFDKKAYQPMWLEYEYGGRSATAFTWMLDYARENGIEVAVVNMPFREHLFELPGDGRAAYRAYQSAMDSLQKEHQFLWLDYQQDLVLTDEDFRDVDHLNPEGGRKLSRRLAHDLVAAFPDEF